MGDPYVAAAKGLTAEDLRAAIRRLQVPRPPLPHVVHPTIHAQACRLLGLPEGSPITNAQFEQAALLEYRQTTEKEPTP